MLTLFLEASVKFGSTSNIPIEYFNLSLKVCSGYKYAFPMFLLPTNVSFTYVKLGVIPVYSDSNHVENSA